MDDADARGWAGLLVLIGGLALYLLVQAAPTQVKVGPLSLGESQGECHGLNRQHGDDVILEFCK